MPSSSTQYAESIRPDLMRLVERHACGQWSDADDLELDSLIWGSCTLCDVDADDSVDCVESDPVDPVLRVYLTSGNVMRIDAEGTASLVDLS